MRLVIVIVYMCLIGLGSGQAENDTETTEMATTDLDSTGSTLTKSELSSTGNEGTTISSPTTLSSTESTAEDNPRTTTSTGIPMSTIGQTTEANIATTPPCDFTCTNGIEAGSCQPNNTICNCTVNSQDFFTGYSCEVINLGVTYQNSTARTINITWPAPPGIDQNQYSFVYKNNGSAPIDTTMVVPDDLDQPHVHIAPFRMLDSTTARLINLNTTTWYVVCVMLTEQANQLADDNDLEKLDPDLPWCVRQETVYNVIYSFTLAAFIIAGLMIGIIIALIIAKLVFDRSLNQQNQDTYYQGAPRSKKKQLLNGSDDSTGTGSNIVEASDAAELVPSAAKTAAEKTVNKSDIEANPSQEISVSAIDVPYDIGEPNIPGAVGPARPEVRSFDTTEREMGYPDPLDPRYGRQPQPGPPTSQATRAVYPADQSYHTAYYGNQDTYQYDPRMEPRMVQSGHRHEADPREQMAGVPWTDDPRYYQSEVPRAAHDRSNYNYQRQARDQYPSSDYRHERAQPYRTEAYSNQSYYPEPEADY